MTTGGLLLILIIINNKYDNTFCDNGLYNNSRGDSTRGIETTVSSEKPLFINSRRRCL